MMQDIVDIRFSKSELNTLVKTKGTCVTFEKKTRVVFLLPSQLLDIKCGIKENLDSHLLKYDYETKAIIIGYEKIKILSKYGSICYGYSKIALRIEASFYLFKPSVGSMLQGVVCKQSGRHLGCLVLKGFNVSIPLEEEACGWDFSIGQDVKFTVAKLDLTSGPLPYILGQLNLDGTERGAAVEDGGVVAPVASKVSVRPPVMLEEGEVGGGGRDEGPWGVQERRESSQGWAQEEPEVQAPADPGGGDCGRDSLISRLLKTVEMSLGEEAEAPQPPAKKQKRASVGPGALLAVRSPPTSVSPHLPMSTPPSAGAKAKQRKKVQGGGGGEDSSGSIIDRLLEMSKRELLGVSEETPTPRGKKRKADGSPLVAIKKERDSFPRSDDESAVKALSADVKPIGGVKWSPVVPSEKSVPTKAGRLSQLKVSCEGVGHGKHESNMSSPVFVETTKSPQKHAKVQRKSLTLKSENFKD